MRLVTAVAIVFASVAGCLGSDATDGAGADGADRTGADGDAWLFFGGHIWTGEDGPAPAAVAVRDGIIVAAGSLADAEAAGGTDAQRVDLGGGMLAPGFFDTHNHVLEYARGSVAVELFAGDDPFQPSVAPWDPVAGTLGQQPTALLHVCHWGLQHAESSGEALLRPFTPVELALVSQSVTRDVCYGEVLRSPDTAEARARLLQLQQASASFGLTSHVEAGSGHDVLQWLWEREAAGDVALRFSVYLWPESFDEALAAGWQLGTGTPHARLLGVKVYTDGWLGPRTAALAETYDDRPHSGFAFYETGELTALVAAAHQAGLKVTAHAIGDRAVDRMLDAYGAALAQPCVAGPHCNDPRFGMEHASLVSSEAIPRMLGYGIIPSVQFSFATSDSHWLEDALGSERADRAYAWRTMTDAGLKLTGSSDWPIEVLPPLWGIERAVTRQDVDGSLPTAFHPAEALDLDTALRMVTIQAAYATFQEHELGSIAVGKRADLVVLGADLFAISPADIAETPVRMTFVDGRLVHGEAPVGAAA